LLLSFATPAAAQAQKDGGLLKLTGPEAIDAKVVQAVLSSQNYEAIAAQLPTLKAICDRAPASYPLIERRGDMLIVREDSTPAMNLQLMIVAAVEKKRIALVHAFNTYGMACFLLMTYANEAHHPEEVLGYGQRGLKMQPDDPHMVTEMATALETLRRPGDALAVIEAWQKRQPVVPPRDGARVLRAKGYALVELKRLDEAEQAYRGSLKLEPDHKGAMRELQYIAGLRTGAPTANASTLVPADKANSGDIPGR
jgi:hypothetical protein